MSRFLAAALKRAINSIFSLSSSRMRALIDSSNWLYSLRLIFITYNSATINMSVSKTTVDELEKMGDYLEGGGKPDDIVLPKANEIPCQKPGCPAGPCFPPNCSVEHFNFWADRCGVCTNCLVLKEAAEENGVYLDSPRK